MGTNDIVISTQFKVRFFYCYAPASSLYAYAIVLPCNLDNAFFNVWNYLHWIELTYSELLEILFD